MEFQNSFFQLLVWGFSLILFFQKWWRHHESSPNSSAKKFSRNFQFHRRHPTQLSQDNTSPSDWFMNNDQSSSQGKLLLENAMPILHEDEEKMIKEASSIADMMKSPEMKFFRKLPKKIPEEVITIEDSDEDPIVIKDSKD